MRCAIVRVIVLAGALVLGPGETGAEDLDGGTLFRKTCGTCHTAEKGGEHRQGPNLFGVFGRAAGAAVGYQYSEAFRNGKSGIAWDRPTLERWLADAQSVIPGAIMIYKVRDPERRARLIDYLATLN